MNSLRTWHEHIWLTIITSNIVYWLGLYPIGLYPIWDPPPLPPKLTCKNRYTTTWETLYGTIWANEEQSFGDSTLKVRPLNGIRPLLKYFFWNSFMWTWTCSLLKRKFSTLFHVMQKLLWNPEKMEPFFNCLITCLLLFLLLAKPKGYPESSKETKFSFTYLSHVFCRAKKAVL